MDPKVFMKSTVLVKWRYVTPAHAARQIRQMRSTCSVAGYLDCVLEHAEVSRITKEFAALHKAPHLADPDAFLRHFEEMDLVLAQEESEPV